jgi:hypothetical protein
MPDRLLKDLDTKKVKAEARVFVNPTNPNTAYQVVEGDNELELNKPFVSMTDGVITRTNRIGDKFAQFNDGLLATDDPQIIAWCESMFPTVMDYYSPETASLATLAKLQTPRADYDPEVSADIVSQIAPAQKRALEEELNRRVAERLKELGYTAEGTG